MIRKLFAISAVALVMSVNSASASQSDYWHDLMFIIGSKSGIIPYSPVPVPDSFDSAAMKAAFNSRPVAYRLRVQSALSDLNFLDGPVDSVWGQKTWKAIDRYAREANVWQGLSTVDGSKGILEHISMTY